jgi:hypothetical protein
MGLIGTAQAQAGDFGEETGIGQQLMGAYQIDY